MFIFLLINNNRQYPALTAYWVEHFMFVLLANSIWRTELLWPISYRWSPEAKRRQGCPGLTQWLKWGSRDKTAPGSDFGFPGTLSCLCGIKSLVSSWQENGQWLLSVYFRGGKRFFLVKWLKANACHCIPSSPQRPELHMSPSLLPGFTKTFLVWEIVEASSGLDRLGDEGEGFPANSSLCFFSGAEKLGWDPRSWSWERWPRDRHGD